MSQGFDFRRGNHFMAPGWMTSKKIYTDVIRPTWLDDQGNYKYIQRFKLKNGHWDRFWDARIGSRECIFPEIPRILHLPGAGFTVRKQVQKTVFFCWYLDIVLDLEVKIHAHEWRIRCCYRWILRCNPARLLSLLS